MHKTPKKVFEKLLIERPPCERWEVLRDHVCQGRSTFEHAWIYSGRQVPDAWAVLRLCEWAHLGDGLNKEINHYLSLRHATPADLAKYPKTDWVQMRTYLAKKYDKY